MSSDLSISVVVPAYNAQDLLPVCLNALNASTTKPTEIIVVDDGSTDLTFQVASRLGAKLLQTAESQSGPANARNLGTAAASGDIVLFVDSDVVVRPDTVARIRRHFAETPELSAVFGSYDSEPTEPNFLSQYKNLQHHHVHQTAQADAETFWAGCGAIRRSLFQDIGGFDSSRYQAPSVEDIELGYRIKAHGGLIRLDRHIQVCHMKRWTFWQLLHTEIFRRAIPWSDLILTRQQMSTDLNLGWWQRISAAMAWTLTLALPLSFFKPWAIAAAAVSAAVLAYGNRDFYRFLQRRRGTWFMLRTIPVHVLYFLYSSFAFAWCWIRQRLVRPSAPDPVE